MVSSEALLTLALENADIVHPAVGDRLTGVSPFSTDYTAPLIWLGNRKLAENTPALRLLRVSHVVNCASSQVASPLFEAEEAGLRKVAYCQLELEDAPRVGGSEKHAAEALNPSTTCIQFDPSAPQAFEKASEFVANAFCESAVDDGFGGPVILVHCAGGVSRSCCALLAYLVARERMTLCNAYAQLLDLRPVIGPNAGFFNVLLDLENAVIGQETMVRPASMHQRSFKPVKETGQKDVKPT